MFGRSTIYPPKSKLITIIVVRGIVNLIRIWQTGVMKTKTPSYQRHRFPVLSNYSSSLTVSEKRKELTLTNGFQGIVILSQIGLIFSLGPVT